MKNLEPLSVTPSLLNELGTLAAPSMLATALHAAFAELGTAYPKTLDLFSYAAEFKEGAREGDSVQIAIEETAKPGDREFAVYFSKGERIGRVGKWQLVFSKRSEGRPLPYRIDSVAADGRTNSQLWKLEPTVATGDVVKDAQFMLWLAGQCARRYMKRLDSELATSAPEVLLDDLETRLYGGIAVLTHLLRWPAQGEVLRCAVQYHLPLQNQPRQDKKMMFDGVLVAEQDRESHLLGTFRFTVVRLNAQRLSIYPNGSTE